MLKIVYSFADNNLNTPAIFKMKNVTPVFVYVTKADITKLDFRIWIRAKEE